MKPRAEILRGGMTLDELGGVLGTTASRSRCSDAADADLDAFRETAVAGARTTDDRFVLVNYLRSAIGQEKGGHISPLAAYDAETDRFLVLDVSRYKYPPIWVDAAALHGDVNTSDADNGSARSRGSGGRVGSTPDCSSDAAEIDAAAYPDGEPHSSLYETARFRHEAPFRRAVPKVARLRRNWIIFRRNPARGDDDGDDDEAGQHERTPAPKPQVLSIVTSRKRNSAAPQRPGTLAKPPVTEVPPITTTAIEASRYSSPMLSAAPPEKPATR